jgi:formylglycine-generating enzyme required for sulfatase activity
MGVDPRHSPPGRAPRKGMVWVPGGTFAMGSEDFYPEERPRSSVDSCGRPTT